MFIGGQLVKLAKYSTTRFLAAMIVSIAVSGCSEKSDLDQASGIVTVQIPDQVEASSYQMHTVNLFEISNLKEVSGKFARFFYSPGSSGKQLIGSAPQARFIKSGSVFIASDILSAQMATIYYHMQNLAGFDLKVGAGEINTWPRSVGLETQIVENDRTRKNNAFYDGITDSMMFVPFTGNQLPISVNAGIIAHEHFHSLFFKMVVKPAIDEKKLMNSLVSAHESDTDSQKLEKTSKPKIISEKKKALLFNEVYLRGLNEGLADFWGWLYTNDPDFMHWSLPDYSEARNLSISAAAVGHYITDEKINDAIDDAIQISEQPRMALVDYAYFIGTPHARFLKQWVQMRMTDEKLLLDEAKVKVAQDVILYLTKLSEKVATLEMNEIMPADDLFKFFIYKYLSEKNMSAETCKFAVEYLNYKKPSAKNRIQCETKDEHIIIKKP